MWANPIIIDDCNVLEQSAEAYGMGWRQTPMTMFAYFCVANALAFNSWNIAHAMWASRN